MWRFLIGLVVIGLVVGGMIWWRPWAAPRPASQRSVMTTSEAPSCGVIAGSSIPAAVQIRLAAAWPAVSLKVGQTIEWLNDTSTAQTLKSETAEGQACAGFTTQDVAPGQSVRLTLLRTGDWSFVAGNGFGGVITVK